MRLSIHLNPTRFAILLLALLAAPMPHAQQRATTRTAGGLGGGGAAREYNNNTTVGEAMISSDPETRKVIIITDEETNLHVGQVIKDLDKPKPQVLIKVLFLEVTHRKDSDLGVEARYMHNLSSSTTAEAATAFGLASQTAGGFYKIMGDNLELTLRAIDEAGKTEVLSAPSILTRNNQEAVITVGQELPFIASSQVTALGQTINTIDYRDIGIILRVTPFITGDGLVEMIVAPEISTLTDQTVPITDTSNYPVIAKRAAETVVVTPDGKTVVIGGLMENNKTEVQRKVPILGDIPLLGALFKRKTKENTKTELIIFLTPYVVREPKDLAGMTERESGRTELAPKSFTNQELDKFMENIPIKGSQTPAEPKKRR